MKRTTATVSRLAAARGSAISRLVLIFLLVCAGCGKQGAGVESGAVPLPVAGNPTTAKPVVPALPLAGAPVSPVQRTSSSTLTVAGDGYAAQAGGNNNASGGGTFSVIPGGDDELAFALYTVPGITTDKPMTLSIGARDTVIPGGDDPLAMSYWVGIANYTTYRWDWHGPLTASFSTTLNSADERDRYVSGSGTVSYVVMTVADAPKTPTNPDGLNGVAVQTSVTTTSATYQPNLPHYTLIDAFGPGNGKAGSSAAKRTAAVPLDPDKQYVTIKWEHVAAFNPDDEQNSAFQYQVFRQGPFDQFPVNIGSELAPEEVYVDPLDNASVSPDPIPGVTYDYFVRAINPAGYTPLSPAGRVKIPLLPPASLAATDGFFDDKIALVWTKAAGATAYEIYRDSATDPVAVVGDVNTWLDKTISDTTVHIYAIKSRNPFGKSVFSKAEPGSKRQAVQTFNLMTGDPTDGPFILMCDAAFNPVTNLPVASYTVDVATSGDDATHLYEFTQASGWQETTPVHHGSFTGGAPCDILFKPNGDLALFFGNIAWMGGNYEDDLVLRPFGQAVGSPLMISDTGGGAPAHVDWNGSEFGFAFTDTNTTPYTIGYSHGTPGSIVREAGTPTVSSADFNYDMAFDSFGDPYIAYVDGKGSPLAVWWLVDTTWNVTTLDSDPCFGVNIAAGQDGEMFILYQHPGELRLAEGKVDKQTLVPSFTTSQIEPGLFLGYLDYDLTDLAVDSQNQPHIIYPTDTLTDGDEKVWYRYRDAQGWQPPYELDFNSQTYIEARNCAIALDANDRPLCVYAHDPYSLRATWFK